MVPAIEASFVQVRRAVDGVDSLATGLVGPERHAVRVLEPLVYVDVNAHLLIANACVKTTQ